MISLNSREEIQRIIPNRYPLMILDHLEIEPGVRASSTKLLTAEDWFFQYHYPNRPILPGFLLMESMTHVFCAAFLACEGEMQEERQEIPVISKIGGDGQALTFLNEATVGDTIFLEADLTSFKRGIAKGKCRAVKKTTEGDVPLLEFSIVEVLPSKMVVPKKNENN